jgi:hypothetical protein
LSIGYFELVLSGLSVAGSGLFWWYYKSGSLVAAGLTWH